MWRAPRSITGSMATSFATADRSRLAILPVDNHELIALCAPRPVFIGGGANTGDGYADPSGDAWADTTGMFLAEVDAGPVYRLLGARDLGTTTFPPVETALLSGDLAFRQHQFGHTPGAELARLPSNSRASIFLLPNHPPASASLTVAGCRLRISGRLAP